MKSESIKSNISKLVRFLEDGEYGDIRKLIDVVGGQLTAHDMTHKKLADHCRAISYLRCCAAHIVRSQMSLEDDRVYAQAVISMLDRSIEVRDNILGTKETQAALAFAA